MKTDCKKLIPLIWKFSVLFYLLRSIAEPLKYLFFVSFGALLISYTYCLIKDFKRDAVVRFIRATKEFLILGLFLASGIILSTQVQIISIKSLVNFFGIAVLFLIYFEYEKHIPLVSLFRACVIFTLVIGMVGILKWLNFILGFDLGAFSLFYAYGTSLVSDYNTYASYFIFSMVIFLYALHKEIIQTKLLASQAVLLLLIGNISLSGSRRGLIVMALFLLIAIYLLLVKREEKKSLLYKNLSWITIIFFAFFLFFVSLIPIRSKIILEDATRKKITAVVYRYSTIFNPNLTHRLFYYKMWPKTAIYENDRTVWGKYATHNNLIDSEIQNKYRDLIDEYWDNCNNQRHTDNLIYNGDFRYGQEFWGKNTPDSINHEIIRTEFGNALRVSRLNGKGHWPLLYQGRDIFYYKDLTYHFRFMFRIVEGKGAPFRIGWWAKDEKPVPTNLHKEIFPINEKWFVCFTSYKFQNDHYLKIKTFMNSQRANTIIDFANIELICNDTLNRPIYADENIDMIDALEVSRMKQQVVREEKKLLSKRTARWKYAKELWIKEYTWTNKLFGRGFDYLDQFGQEFYPGEERIDYPHNPIISSFLYSGIIGGAFYIYFLMLTFWYYWRYRKHHLLFFVLFLIYFAFIFISSDNHFTVPIFAILSLVPFITRYVVLAKDNKSLT